MELTHEELKELLASRVDEVTLLDILEITSEQLVEMFDEKVEQKREQLIGLVDCGNNEEEYYD
jgi:hypothetical protein